VTISQQTYTFSVSDGEEAQQIVVSFAADFSIFVA